MCEQKNFGRKNTQFLVQHMFFEQILRTMQNFHRGFLTNDLGRQDFHMEFLTNDLRLQKIPGIF